MGYTLAEKLIMNNLGCDKISTGDLVTVNVNQVMIHDMFAPFVISKFIEMGFQKVWNSEKIAFIYDHLIPASFIEDIRPHVIANEFASEQDISRVHRSDGVCHQLMVELKYAKPGDIVFGTDSHTTTYGAVGAFSTGIGYTEMAAVLGAGKLWLKVPSSLKFIINGNIPKGVFSKDIILKIIGDIGAEGASYKSMEFSGSTIESMSIASRMVMSNMSVEAGAKVGLFEPDNKVFEFYNLNSGKYSHLKSDDDARFEKIYEYKAEDFEPVVACPSNVDNIQNIEKVQGISIDQAFLGSCTNGRLEDLEIAANIIRGKKVAPFVKLIVVPASNGVYRQALEKGYISALVEAGAIVNPTACGLCCGRSGGIVSDGERVIASNNRNFLGRMGSPKSEIFLASPASVVASAIDGKIADPRKYL